MNRLAAIDRLRGIVMVLMALDHARDFFGDPKDDPTRLATTTAALFFTRWITHYCAPVFVMLAGTSAYLMRARGDSPREVARFLATRGLWLIVLELTVVRVGWLFDLTFQINVLQVIWAIGWSMLTLAALVALPSRVVGGLGLATIVLHNLLDRVPHAPSWLWTVLHEPGRIGRFVVVYPLVPWVGVIAVGYALGEVLGRDDRRRRLLQLGLGTMAMFFVVRGINLYGDPKPWSAALHPVLSFLDCTKYPPSLAYLTMTLGPALVALAVLEDVKLPALETIGRVPLFYYVVHL